MCSPLKIIARQGDCILFTFHIADAAVAFVDLEVRGVEDLERHLAAVAAAFVQHFFCTHNFICVALLGRSKAFCFWLFLVVFGKEREI